MSNLSADVGKRIQAFRKAKGLTQQQLADRIGKGKGAVSKYESGAIVIDIDTLSEIAGALQIPVSALLYANNQPESQNSRSYSVFCNSDNLYVYNVKITKKKPEVNPSRIIFTPNCNGDGTIDSSNLLWYIKLRDVNDLSTADAIVPGKIEVFETASLLTFSNKYRHNYKTMFYILNFVNNNTVSRGLETTMLSFPAMPLSCRVLVSTRPIDDNVYLMNNLILSRAELKNVSSWNGLSVKSGMLNDYL